MASVRMTSERDQLYAVIDTAATDTTIVAAVAAKKILVTYFQLVASGGAQTLIRWESGTAGTALTGEMDLGDNLPLIGSYNPAGHFQTAVNTLLNLQITAATSVDGWLTYVLID